MNTNAMFQAMNEREMINLITDLMKFREREGKEKFKAVILQMKELLNINSDISDQDLKIALSESGVKNG